MREDAVNYYDILNEELLEFKELSNEGNDEQLELVSNFPKTCRNCSKTYESVSHFNQATKALTERSAIYIEELDKLTRFRNCECGSTLVVVYREKEKQNSVNARCSSLYNKCIGKIVTECKCTEEFAGKVVEMLFMELSTDMSVSCSY